MDYFLLIWGGVVEAMQQNCACHGWMRCNENKGWTKYVSGSGAEAKAEKLFP